MSPEAFELRQEHNETVLRTARSLLETTEDKKDLLHLELLIKNIEDEQKSYEMNCHLYAVNSIGYGGVHNNFIEALDWLGEENKAANFLSRLSAFPHQCAQYKELLLLGVERKCVASVSMVRKVPEQLTSLLAALDSNTGPLCDLLATLFPAPASDAATSDASVLAHTEAMAKKELFRAAVADLLVFFETTYIPQARPESGCSGMLEGKQRGAEIYAQCLKYHTTTSLTAKEIHTIGLEEVARIRHRYQVCT